MRWPVVLLLLLVVPTLAAAQVVATPTSKIALDVNPCQGCPAMDVPTATGFTYRYYLDGAVAAQTLTGAICAGTTTITCTFPLPAFTAGAHSITVTASNVIGESQKSIALSFVMVRSAPGAPTIRITP